MGHLSHERKKEAKKSHGPLERWPNGSSKTVRETQVWIISVSVADRSDE